MLPPFIIEQIRRRENEERMRQEDDRRPRLELPVDLYHPSGESDPRSEKDDDSDTHRGIVILDLG